MARAIRLAETIQQQMQAERRKICGVEQRPPTTLCLSDRGDEQSRSAIESAIERKRAGLLAALDIARSLQQHLVSDESGPALRLPPSQVGPAAADEAGLPSATRRSPRQLAASSGDGVAAGVLPAPAPVLAVLVDEGERGRDLGHQPGRRAEDDESGGASRLAEGSESAEQREGREREGVCQRA